MIPSLISAIRWWDNICRIRSGVSSGAKERALKIMEIQETSSIDLSRAGSEGVMGMGTRSKMVQNGIPKSHSNFSMAEKSWAKCIRLNPLATGSSVGSMLLKRMKPIALNMPIHALAARPVVSNLDSRFAGNSVDKIFILWLSIWPRNLSFWSIPVSIASW